MLSRVGTVINVILVYPTAHTLLFDSV